jgi:hypothetical protein
MQALTTYQLKSHPSLIDDGVILWATNKCGRELFRCVKDKTGYSYTHENGSGFAPLGKVENVFRSLFYTLLDNPSGRVYGQLAPQYWQWVDGNTVSL